MLTQLIAFEWRYHTRQPSFPAACALFFMAGFTLTGTSFGPENVMLTSPFLVMQTMSFAALFSVFAIAIFVSNAVIRDTEHRMEEIVFCTPIGRFNYVASRFAGALAAALTATVLTPIGMLIATRMPWIEATRLGPIHLLTYVWAFVAVVAPTLLFATALLFALAARTRSSLATYTASIFIYLLYLFGSAMTNSPLMASSSPGAGGGSAVALLDPFGLSAFFELTRHWTIAEKNRRFIALSGPLLLNRLLWTGVAVAIFGWTYRSFSFRVLRRAKVKKARRALDTTTPAPQAYRRVTPLQRSVRVDAASLTAATRFEVAVMLRSVPFLLLLVFWFVLAITEIRSELFEREYGSAAYAVTPIIVAALRQPLTLIGIIIVIYYSAEVFWREQRFRVASIVDATPTRGGVMAVAKWGALVAMLALTILVGIAAGVVTQLGAGHFALQPAVYVSLFYLVGLPLALLAAAAMGIHSLSPGKYAGLLFVLVFATISRVLSLLDFGHPLWRFGAGPFVGYSDFYGMSDAASGFGWMMLHWSLVAAGFLAIAALAWRRLQDSVPIRLKSVARVVTRHRLVAGAFLLTLLLTGGWVYYDSAIRGDYRTTTEVYDWRAGYERTYRPMAGAKQPRIVAIRTQVDLYPAERRVRIAGTYTLMNDTQQPITTVDAAIRREARNVRMSIASAKAPQRDELFGMYRFSLAQPLAPGGKVDMNFDLTFERDGSFDSFDMVTENGSLVMGYLAYPSLGYRSNYELQDSRERRKRGLGASSTPEADDTDVLSSRESSDMQRVSINAVVTTSAEQMAFAPGRLLSDTTANGRRRLHFMTDTPIRNFFGIASARYVVARRKTGGVEILLAHSPAHGANAERILDAAAITVAYCQKEFGPYPHRQIKLVEVPSSWSFGAFATPDTIYLNEDRTMQVDPRDPARPDLLARRVAHEIGHLWWGHQLQAESRGGASMLIETLAKYTEIEVLQELHGADHVQLQLERELDRYLSGRSRETQHERTLANVGAQSYIYYAKGSIVMHAIAELLGREAMNAALRELLATHRGGRPATSAALLQQLRKRSTDVQYALIRKWTQEIVLYDFTLSQPRLSALPNGRFRVTVGVAALHLRGETDGEETSVPLDESIEIALYRSAPLSLSSGLMAIRSIQLRNGSNEVSFEVAEKPAWIVIDPRILRIDRNRFDNAVRVEE